MMGQNGGNQNRLFYSFNLEDHVPASHLLRRIDKFLDLTDLRAYLVAIKQRIAGGMFQLEEEFPDYRHLRKVVGASGVRTCSQVFDEYIAHCEARLAKNDMAAATVTSYRKALDSIWRPQIGTITFLDIRYSTLVKIADSNMPTRDGRFESSTKIARAMQGAVESDIDAIKRAMRLDSGAIQANTKPKAAARKSRRADSTKIRTASRPSDESEVATYSAFGTGFGTSKELPQPKSLTCNKKKWRRGWDSNPRAGITRPSDFESAPL
jgi:hypothetical protein